MSLINKTNNKIAHPDPVHLSCTYELCTTEQPYAVALEHTEKFKMAMREIMLWHQAKSKFYARLLLQQNFDPKTWQGDLGTIPLLSADFFKLHEVKSIGDTEVVLHMTSSGTTGQKSQIFFDAWTLACGQHMVDVIFKHYQWIQEKPANYLLYSYEPQANLKLGTSYTDNFLTKYAPIENVVYALRSNGKAAHDFDLFGCIRALQDFAKQGLPVRIFGFPAFFYFTIQRMVDLGMPDLKLHPESLVFLGGGWKGHAEQAIDKKEFYKLVENKLGIPNERLRDGYGSVEHCIPYVECTNHHFHAPIYAKVMIRDLRNLNILAYGETGFIQFLSPYITSVPAHSIMMGDLARLYPGKDCGCGLTTDWFEILGRAGTTQNKSCAIAASELLRAFT